MNFQLDEIQNSLLFIGKYEALLFIFLVIAFIAFIPILKELMAFFLIRYSLKITCGDWVKLPETTGEIRSQNFFHLCINYHSGSYLFIPNTRFLKQMMQIQKQGEPFVFVLEFFVNYDSQKSLQSLIESIYQIAVISSYRALNDKPQVELILVEEHLKIRCICFACNAECVAPYRHFMLKSILENTHLLEVTQQNESTS